MLISVVLPAPLGPSRPKNSPCGISRLTPRERAHRAVALLDAANFYRVQAWFRCSRQGEGFNAVEAREGLQSLGQIHEGELAFGGPRIAQPREAEGEQRRIHLGDLAEVDRASPLGEVLPAFLQQLGDVGEGHRAAHHDAPPFAPDHFFPWFLARSSLISPSMLELRTVLENSVR